MSDRRNVLDVLTRPRLREIALKVGIEFYANTSRPEMLDSVSRSHSIPFKDLLAHYRRDELKLACQKLDLDDAGRERQVLIRRLVVADRQACKPVAERKSPSRTSKLPARTTRGPRSNGTSTFLNGVNDMDEPKVTSEPAPGEHQEDAARVELVWPGKKREVDRVVLPFQQIEIVNESRATREAEKVMPMAKSFKAGEAKSKGTEWRNKLIWGDNKYVLGSLLEQYAGQIDLIYIDPPFATGQDFSFDVEVGGESMTKEPSLIEEKAYRDTWGQGLSSYLQMLYDRLVLIRGLLAPTGSIYVHIGPNINHYVRALMDEVFTSDRHLNEIVWRRAFAHSDSNRCGIIHDAILLYTKSASWTWNVVRQAADPKYVETFFDQVDEVTGKRYQRISLTAPGITKNGESGRPWRGINPTAIGRHWAKKHKELDRLDKEGRIHWPKKGVPRLKRYEDEYEGMVIQDIWTDVNKIHNQAVEATGYATQKPTALLERIIKASSNEGDLVADLFAGSGTTGVVAETLNRRWVMADLSRWAIQTARKRLLDIEACKPFEVLNLGKYERQYWQGVTFGKGRGEQKALHEYVRFVLDLYRAELTSGLAHIHGQRSGCMIHVGAADSPVTLAEIREAVNECKKINQAKLDILGWEWEMGLHDVIEAESKRSGVKLRLLQIPRECMDQRAVDAGDVHFYELAYLEVEPERRKGSREVRIKLKNFVIPSPELIPDDVRSKIKKWSDFIDYWSVDFEFNEDVFHNQWQDYRTRSKRDLELTTDWHEYAKGGAYKVLVKVFDIFGNDTTQLLEVKV